MTRAKFLKLFASAAEAIEFEHGVLSVGSEFLPAEARKVRDGKSKPSAAYWDFLAEQFALMSAEVEQAGPQRAPKGSVEAKMLIAMPAELKARVESAAKREGISQTEWWRQAAEAQLKR